MSGGMEMVPEERTLWRRFLDFPLVALIVGMAVFACIVAIGTFVQKSLPASMPMVEG